MADRERGRLTWGVTEVEEEEFFQFDWTLKRFSAYQRGFEIKSPTFRGPKSIYLWHLEIHPLAENDFRYVYLCRSGDTSSAPKLKARWQLRLLDRGGKSWKEVKFDRCDFKTYWRYRDKLMLPEDFRTSKWKQLIKKDTLRFQCSVWIEGVAKLTSGTVTVGHGKNKCSMTGFMNRITRMLSDKQKPESSHNLSTQRSLSRLDASVQSIREGERMSWGVTEMQEEEFFEYNWTLKGLSAYKGGYEMKSPTFRGPTGPCDWHLELVPANKMDLSRSESFRVYLQRSGDLPATVQKLNGSFQVRLLDREGKHWKEIKTKIICDFIKYSRWVLTVGDFLTSPKWKELIEDDTLRLQCSICIGEEAKLTSGSGDAGPHSATAAVPDSGKEERSVIGFLNPFSWRMFQ